jgi:hypothetical protein
MAPPKVFGGARLDAQARCIGSLGVNSTCCAHNWEAAMKLNLLLGTLACGAVGALVVSAGATSRGGVTEAGLVVLHPTADGALSMTGNSLVEVPSAAVYVNSSSQNAVTTTGTAILDTPDLYIVGDARFSGGSYCTGVVHPSAVPFANPCAGFSAPSSSSAPNRGSLNVNSNSTVTLQPGRYTGRVRITGNAQVTMQPGLYFIEDGMSVNAASIRGEEVTIILVRGDLSMAANGEMRLSAPDDGPTAGYVIHAVPQCTGQLSLAGGADAVVSGTIYAPNQLLTLTGNSALEGQGPQMGDVVVVNRVRLTGTSIIRIGRENAPPIQLPTQSLFD